MKIRIDTHFVEIGLWAHTVHTILDSTVNAIGMTYAISLQEKGKEKEKQHLTFTL